MDPIEIIIKIIIGKDGDIKIVQEKKLDEAHVEEVPYRGQLDHALKVKFECRRWAIPVGRKAAGSCKGCTIQCHMRNVYTGQKDLEITRKNEA